MSEACRPMFAILMALPLLHVKQTAPHAPLFPEANWNRFEQRPPSMLDMQQELR